MLHFWNLFWKFNLTLLQKKYQQNSFFKIDWMGIFWKEFHMALTMYMWIRMVLLLKSCKTFEWPSLTSVVDCGIFFSFIAWTTFDIIDWNLKLSSRHKSCFKKSVQFRKFWVFNFYHVYDQFFFHKRTKKIRNSSTKCIDRLISSLKKFFFYFETLES